MELFIKQDGKCIYTGIFLNFTTNQGGIGSTASLDRIDSNKDYTKDNVQFVHRDVNKMKMDFSNEYFLYMCRLIADNQKKEIDETT